jgi:NitT/TauT family transport system substrate-binding protein
MIQTTRGQNMLLPNKAIVAGFAALALMASACGGDSREAGTAPTPRTEETGADAQTGDDDQAQPEALVPLTFQLNWTWYASDHSYFQTALDEGFFEEQGLDVTVREGNGSGTTLKLIGTGDAPLGFVDGSTLIHGMTEGIDTVRSIGVVNQVSPMAVIFKAEKGYEEITDLEGARIAGTQGDAFSQIFPAVLAANGMETSDVQLISTANPPAKEVAVLNDNADALLGYFNEQALRMEATEDVEMDWIRFSEAGVNTLNMTVVGNTDWLDANPDVAASFLAAIQQAIQFTVENPQAAAEHFAAAHDNFDLNLALAQIEGSLDLFHTANTEDKPYLWSAEEDWQETQQVLIDYVGLETDVSADAYHTNEYLDMLPDLQ